MPKLLQINVVANWGSTGKIAESIGNLCISQGWESFITWRRYMNPSQSKLICVGSKLEMYLHGALSLFDRHGLGSRHSTKKLIQQIKDIQPDIIHLHVIHDYYINYPILFKFLKEFGKPVVWTFHDCWAFTGHCAYFEAEGCKKWKECCHHCINLKKYPRSFIDRSRKNFLLKKECFTNTPNMVIVPVSNWLNNLTKQSFLKDIPTRVIHNGINTEVFHPIENTNVRKKYNIDKNKQIILGVSSLWEPRKGLTDFIELSKIIDKSRYQIILVGIDKKTKKRIPIDIICIGRTDNVGELVSLYSEALVFLNPTYEDNFPTVNIEALACGTPVVTYNTGGSIEAVDEETGFIVEQGDISGLYRCIKQVVKSDKDTYIEKCRKRAVKYFDAKNCFAKYIKLYSILIKQKTSLI